MMIYSAMIWLGSVSIRAGTVDIAEATRLGATFAVHSTFGYFGRFIGPLAIGWILDGTTEAG
ncbi:hypothetical protein ACVIIV_002696 [Bradyrhizobium sp. USDA 4354]